MLFRSALALCAFVSCCSAFAGDATYVRKPNDPAALHPSLAIRWREYSPEVFKEAERTGKPLFFFVSSSWIKAGREMERVTLGEVEVATRLNDEFIPVRVDRDVRPDLDIRLQSAVQAVSGARGWPLCAFVTPNGHVFAGGTFFPADDDPAIQKPGLRNVIFQVMNIWKNQRAAVLKAGEALSATLSKTDSRPALTELPPDPLSGVAQGYWVERETLQQRPPGSVLLFPAPRAIEAALIVSVRAGDQKGIEAALEQLNAMMRGGIYDAVNDGFFRCATDGDWRVPRFEKLLVQNAEMIRLLRTALQISQDNRYGMMVIRTQAAMSTLGEGQLLYASALPGGTSDTDDGDAYTWTVREIEDCIPDPALADAIKTEFAIDELGDLPASSPHRNVLPNRFWDRAALPPALHLATSKPLRDYRAASFQKLRHSGIINVDSNALLLATWFEDKVLGGDFAVFNRTQFDALLKLVPAHAISADGKVLSPALLSDEAAVALACAAAFQFTGDKKYEEHGVAALERIEKNFLDETDGTFFDRPASVTDFPSANGRVKLYADTWEPSPIGLAAQAFLTWGTLLDRPTYIMRAKKCVLGCGDIIEGLGHYGATLAGASDWLRNGGVTITIVSKPDAPEAAELFKTAHQAFAPWKIIRRAPLPENVPGVDTTKTNAYASVERNGRRELVRTPEQLKAAIAKLVLDPKKEPAQK